MNKKTIEAIDALIEEVGDNGPPRDDEFTAQDFLIRQRDKLGHSVDPANVTRHLNKLVSSGALTVRKGWVNSKSGNVYKPA